MKIYIVDDEESVCIALKRLIRSSGHIAETFNSAVSFLDSVTPHDEGILILDVRMPKMDGFQLQEKLNAMNSRLKIIFITAHASAEEKERTMKAGAKAFLQKPFDDDSLLNLINSLSSQDQGENISLHKKEVKW